MDNTPLFFIANWKMNMPFTRACSFAEQYKHELDHLARTPTKTIVLCPSFPALAPLVTIFDQTKIAIGAQNCSTYTSGAYTGEVSAESLAQIGCRFALVGHSERRNYFDETPQDTAQKVARLLEHNITPILCIGEDEQAYTEKNTFAVLEEQLEPVMDILVEKKVNPASLMIAYEPVWAIGTGKIPNNSYLKEIVNWLAKKIPGTIVLYGGSVSENNVTELASIQHLRGFLIGGASLDFQKFKKIVEFKEIR